VAVAELTVHARRDRHEVVLTLRGEIDVSTAGSLRAAVEQAVAGSPSRVVLDFDGVTFCDSQGLSTLIALRRVVAATGGTLVLTHLGPFVTRLIDITGLREAFQLED
jgi:anti-sigma B factor antagonist